TPILTVSCADAVTAQPSPTPSATAASAFFIAKPPWIPAAPWARHRTMRGHCIQRVRPRQEGQSVGWTCEISAGSTVRLGEARRPIPQAGGVSRTAMYTSSVACLGQKDGRIDAPGTFSHLQTVWYWTVLT